MSPSESIGSLSLPSEIAAALLKKKAEAAREKSKQPRVKPEKRSRDRMAYAPWLLDWEERMALETKDVSRLILIRLDELWWQGRKYNPVLFPGFTRDGVSVFGHRKARGLEKLERNGFISVERRYKKSPLVTLNWRTRKLPKGE